MSLYYSDKKAVSQLHFSNGSSKLPIKELYYSDGSTKSLIWSNGFRPPTSKYPYMIFASTGATYDNGKIVSWPSDFSAISQEMGSGDWRGFYGSDYWGNMIGGSRNMGDNRYNYLVFFAYNPSTSQFVQTSHDDNASGNQILSDLVVFDPLVQMAYLVNGYQYIRFKPTTIDPTLSRSYTKLDSSYIKLTDTSVTLPTSSNRLGTFAGPLSNRLMYYTSGSGAACKLYYTNLQNASRYAFGGVSLPSDSNVIIPDVSGDIWSYNVFVFCSQTNSLGSFSINIYYYEYNSGTLSLISTRPYYRISRQIGYSNDMKKYYFILQAQDNVTPTQPLEVFDLQTKKFNLYPSLALNKFNVVPQVSTDSLMVNYGLSFTNITGSYQSYTGDVTWSLYHGETTQKTKTFSQIRFTNNGLSFHYNTPYFDYYKDIKLREEVEAQLNSIQ